MADHVFPEDQGTNSGIDEPGYGDNDDAANFASAFESPNNADYVLRGLEFQNIDYANGTFDLTAGKARVSAPSADTSQTTGETRDQRVVWTAEVDARSALPLEAGANYVYLDVLLEADDSLTIEINTTETPPSEPSLYLGWIDTDEGSFGQVNRAPSGSFETLEVSEPPEEQTDVARKAEVDDVSQSLSDHSDQTQTHGANGAIQGENDVSQAISDHSNNSNAHHSEDHASRHHSGGADELDAGDLSGSSGSEGQTLKTDGTQAYWGEGGGGKEAAKTYSLIMW